jgi:hypothetical protein
MNYQALFVVHLDLVPLVNTTIYGSIYTYMANLPRDEEYKIILRENNIDIHSFPIEVILKSFYEYTLSQTGRIEHALLVIKKYKEKQ